MAATTAAAFFDDLAASKLLDAAPLAALRAEFDEALPPQEIADTLVDRGILTRWQSVQLFKGRESFFIDRYKLLEKVGQGGMATVFKAEREEDGKIVALKVLNETRLNVPGAMERFKREMRAVAALDHPNMVAAYDAVFGGQDHPLLDFNTSYLVMEFVEGRDIRAYIDAYGQLPIPWSVECIRQAAVGLQHAHERGLVHRDIKPSNLVVVNNPEDPRPEVKVLDMGLARFTSEAQSEVLTKTGQVIGTADYIAPEQIIDTRGVDHRADLFSLGATLYRMITGEPPYPGKDPGEKLKARATREPSPARTLRPEISPELEAVLAKMLARKPEDRYQSATEVIDALAPFGFAAVESPESGEMVEEETIYVEETSHDAFQEETSQDGRQAPVPPAPDEESFDTTGAGRGQVLLVALAGIVVLVIAVLALTALVW